MRFTVSMTGALTTCQERGLEALKRRGNVFLTGAAGTGKSYLLRKFLDGASQDEVPVVASTGAAAVLVGGRTFHSFFGLGILEGGPDATVLRALKSGKVVRRLSRARCVVIDEVSMLSGATLAAAEAVARRARDSEEPWGGLRIIAVGDFAQLPPVSLDGGPKDWAFLHAAWGRSGFRPAMLETVTRTDDGPFLKILNLVREGRVTDDVREFLDAHTAPSLASDDCTRLYPHRAQAERYNVQRLESIRRPLHEFPTRYVGHEKNIESARRVMPIPDVLRLKKGALVMMRRNDPQGRWVNGSLGHIRDIAEDELSIGLLDGDVVEVGVETFSHLNGDGAELASASNFPVTLAWATTIHKAQGATLDRIAVDVSSLWEPGQAYVALSRVRSSKGLCIERWHPSSIRAEPLVTALYERMRNR